MIRFRLLPGALALGAALAAGPACAATYTVATNGSDSSNGVSAPFKTVGKALQVAQEGDTITLRGGTYAGGITVSKARITLQGAAGEKAVISSATDSSGVDNVVKLSTGAIGARLSRLEIVGGRYYGVKIEGDKRDKQTVIEDCVVRSAGQDCFKLAPGADGVTIRRTEIAYSGQVVTSNAEGIDNVCADRMLVQDCYIHDIATNGVYPKGGARDCVIERTRIDNCGVGGVMLGFYTDLEWFDTSENPRYFESIRGTVRNCVITNTGGAGVGLYAAQDAKVYNNTLVNVAKSYHAGVELCLGDTPTQCEGLSFVNNVVVLASSVNRAVFGIRSGAYKGGISASNNVFFRNGQSVYFDDQGWTGNLTSWQSRKGCEADSAATDPKLNADYMPLAGSPCLGKGLTLENVLDDILGKDRYGAYDIGAVQANGTGGGGDDTDPEEPNNPPVAEPSVIYTDVLATGWKASVSGVNCNMAATGSVYEGTACIGMAVTKADGYLLLAGTAVDLTGKSVVKFALHGGTTGGQQLRVRAMVNGVQKASVSLWSYGGKPVKNGWVEVSIPLADLQAAGGTLTGLKFSAGSKQDRAFVDAIRVE